MKNFLNTKTASTTNSLIIIFLSLFTLIFISFSFEAKADLVDEIVKKNNLDPKNSLQDHCMLMVQLDYEIGRNARGNKRCYKDICRSAVGYYNFNGIKWTKERIDIIYKNHSKIIGRVIADDIIYESYDKLKSDIEQPKYFLEKKVDNIKYEDLKNSDIHYIKTRGCRIEETNLNINNLNK